jgi:hypothetical protein
MISDGIENLSILISKRICQELIMEIRWTEIDERMFYLMAPIIVKTNLKITRIHFTA